MSNFVSFPPVDAVLTRLWEMDSAPAIRRELYQAIADRLGSRTLDSAAAAFILIETVHQYSDLVGEDLGDFIPRCIFVLCDDPELADSARGAYQELRTKDSQTSSARPRDKMPVNL